MWERLTRTILTLVSAAGLGLLIWTITGGAPLRDARLALAALLVYVALRTLIVRVDHAIHKGTGAGRAHRGRGTAPAAEAVAVQRRGRSCRSVGPRARAAGDAVSAGESTAERVILTMDDATLPAVGNIATILHALGFVVGIERA